MTDQNETKYNWLKNRMCPHCGSLLFSDWIWTSEIENHLDEWQDYATWFLVCEECQENFIDENGELVECS